MNTFISECLLVLSIDKVHLLVYNKDKIRRGNTNPKLIKYHYKGVFTMLTNERIKELNAKIAALQEWEALAKEAAAEAEAIKDEIKAVMNEQATEEMTVDTHIVRWTTTLSNRFDTTTFKKEHNEMYKQYTKQTTSRRFSIT